jgi:hypothetical protein
MSLTTTTNNLPARNSRAPLFKRELNQTAADNPNAVFFLYGQET